MFVLPLVRQVFFWVIILYNCASSSPLRVGSVEIAVESNFSDYGNNRLPPINRMTVSPDTYCVRAKAIG